MLAWRRRWSTPGRETLPSTGVEPRRSRCTGVTTGSGCGADDGIGLAAASQTSLGLWTGPWSRGMGTLGGATAYPATTGRA